MTLSRPLGVESLVLEWDIRVRELHDFIFFNERKDADLEGHMH